MKDRNQLIFGAGLILLGALVLISNLFHVDFGMICWPTFLILAGAWMLLRPRLMREGGRFDVRIFGNIHRSGTWSVADQEHWGFITDMNLDLTQAELPEGESVIRINSFVGDIDVKVPADAALSVRANGFVTDVRFKGNRYGGFLVPVNVASEGYADASRRVRVDLACFVGDLKVQQI
jgi:predicted membrane protein